MTGNIRCSQALVNVTFLLETQSSKTFHDWIALLLWLLLSQACFSLITSLVIPIAALLLWLLLSLACLLLITGLVIPIAMPGLVSLLVFLLIFACVGNIHVVSCVVRHIDVTCFITFPTHAVILVFCRGVSLSPTLPIRVRVS